MLSKISVSEVGDVNMFGMVILLQLNNMASVLT